MEALGYAARLHADQTRKGEDAVPYVAHLLAVCSLVLEDGGCEDEAIGALLHDAAEDQGGRPRLAEIAERFGPAVAAIVEACTDTFEEPKPPWVPRKQAYLRHLSHHVAQPELVPGYLRVTLADKLHNARSIRADVDRYGESVYDRFTNSGTTFEERRANALRYYISLAEALAGQGWMGAELGRVVRDLGGGSDGLL